MNPLRAIYTGSFLFSVHLALLSYVNSSMLAEHLSSQSISIAYAAGSLLSIIAVLTAPHIIKAIGNKRFIIGALTLGAALLLMLSFGKPTSLVVGAFIAYFALTASIWWSFDLFVEHYSSNQSTGTIRGTYLAAVNAGWVGIPALVGIIANNYGFGLLYGSAAVLLAIVAMIIMISQKKFIDRVYVKPNIKGLFVSLRNAPALRRIMAINFLLQLFFAWMVIYSPIYLFETIGFSWKEIGIIFAIMILPFVLTQYPAGKWIDRVGSVRPLYLGISLAVLGVWGFVSLENAPLLAYAGVLFLSRIGAALIEVAADAYFFKRVTDSEAAIISAYRMMTPLAYIVGPLAGAFILLYAPILAIFATLCVILLLSLLYTRRISD